MLDRIDMTIQVPALTEEELTGTSFSEVSMDICARVEKGRSAQLARQANAHFALGAQEIETFFQSDEAGLTLLKTAIAGLNLSAKAYHRILKLVRTIADLAS